MIRWMSENTRKFMIRNQDVEENLAITPIKEKIREMYLRLFGHVYRRSKCVVVRRSGSI